MDAAVQAGTPLNSRTQRRAGFNMISTGRACCPRPGRRPGWAL